MSNSPEFRLSAGDRAPNCMGITTDGAVYASEAQSGRAVVMILARNLAAPNLIPLLAAFSAQADRLAACNVDLVTLIDEDINSVLDFSLANPSRVTLIGNLNDFLERNSVNVEKPKVLSTTPKEFMATIGFDSEAPEILVIDSNQRVAGRFAAGDIESQFAATMQAVEWMPFEPPHAVCSPAPVLILPNLLDPALCQELIDLHNAGPTIESPTLVTDAKGDPQHKVDYRLKKRRDLFLEREHPVSIRLQEIIKQRCIPEIKRCFQSDVSHMDRFNIACYPGDGGLFRRHRDNRPEIVSFRKFALSINLTPRAQGYEGGYLRLPEFNGNHSPTPTGAGVMFSVALLHEIAPVLNGNRYVLITHLHDDEGEARWQAMRKTMTKVGFIP